MRESGSGGPEAESAEAMAARVRASFERQAMMATLGARLTAVERGRVELVVDHDDRFTQQHGFMHAGAVAAVLDSACGYAAFSVMPPRKWPCSRRPTRSTCSRPRPGGG
ncbi:MAG TPA: PaaI family thioesterase [Trebonia sp.]|nr:PaaI family thioesterase [Trebonia sp.]